MAARTLPSTMPLAGASFPVRAHTTPSAGKQLLALVQWAVENRERALKWGWGRTDVAFMTTQVALLKRWLGQHAAACDATVRRFDAELGATLRMVLPTNAAGKAKCREYERILNTL